MMERFFILFFSMIVFLSFNLDSRAQNIQEEIIAIINGEGISRNSFNRLLNSQKKRFYKAKEENIAASVNDFDKSWKDLIAKYESIENLEKKASETSLTIANIRQKIEENILLEKLFEKQTKEKLIEKIINETLLLQAARARNITVSEEEITTKLNLIKEKQGGEEAFKRFLSENNATIEDARIEIKNQILIQLVKDKIKNLNTYLTTRKTKSDIVIYTNKLFPKESDTLANIEDLRLEEKDISDGSNNTPVIKMGEETSNIIANEIQKDEEVQETLAPENKVIQTNNVQNRMENSSKILKELRRKIEQRRVGRR